MLTGLSLRTDRSEYSRHEPSRSIVKLRLLPTPATGLADTVTLVLRRKGGPLVATQQISLTGDLPKGSVTTFDLTAIRDENGFPLCTRGNYRIEAWMTADADITTPAAASIDLRIALITAEQMRKTYCFGVPLYASDSPMPKRQPVLVTGVTITRLSEDTRKGIHALAFDATANTLTWAGGAAITIDSAKEILPDPFGGYAEVDIDEFELPAEDAAEGIVVDKQDMDDDLLRSEIDKAIAEAENVLLKVMIEPQRIATEPYFDPAIHDRQVQPLMFTRRDFNANGLAWRLDLPIHQVQKVDILEGFLGNSRALVISGGALTVQPKTGEVVVLPYDSQYSYLYTFFLQLQFWGTREYIANFWRYSGIAGIKETPEEVLKLIGYIAGVTILTIGGQGYRGGFSSESNSKDGVSRTVSYTASASYGIYSATIVELKEWIKTNAPKIRTQYRGIPTVVL